MNAPTPLGIIAPESALRSAVDAVYASTETGRQVLAGLYPCERWWDENPELAKLIVRLREEHGAATPANIVGTR